MDDKRDRVRGFLRDVMAGDFAAALDDEGMDPDLHERSLRLVDLLEAADVDGLVALSAPDMVVTQPPEIPGARTYHGPEGFLDACIDWPSQWAETKIEPVRTWQAGPDVTITKNHQTVRAAATGIEFEADFWFVLAWRDGLLARWSMHVSEEDAVRAAAGDQASAPSSRPS